MYRPPKMRAGKQCLSQDVVFQKPLQQIPMLKRVEGGTETTKVWLCFVLLAWFQLSGLYTTISGGIPS